jgi:uncharacterized OsmC-like protein
MNHVNLDAIRKTVEVFTKEPEKAVKENVVNGEWVMEESGPQFKATLSYEKGSATLTMDNPTPMGGTGSAPNPLQFCLFGMASCFASTYVMVATQKGVVIDKLSIQVKNTVDMTRPLGISQNPLTDGVRISLTVKSKANESLLKEIEAHSREQCPAVYCLTNPIPLSIELITEK